MSGDLAAFAVLLQAGSDDTNKDFSALQKLAKVASYSSTRLEANPISRKLRTSQTRIAAHAAAKRRPATATLLRSEKLSQRDFAEAFQEQYLIMPFVEDL